MSPLFGFIGLGPVELCIVAVIGVLVFGRKLPEVGRYLGKGIVESLEYTMKDYLKQTNGTLRTGAREEWELAKCKDMLCHNNGAERPFAVLVCGEIV